MQNIINEIRHGLDNEEQGEIDSSLIEDLIAELEDLSSMLDELARDDDAVILNDVNSGGDLGLNEILVRLKLNNDEKLSNNTMERAVYNMLAFQGGPGVKFKSGEIKKFPIDELKIISRDEVGSESSPADRQSIVQEPPPES